MRLSVIIPVLDEARVIEPCLRQLARARDVDVVVVDGGSSDGTAARAREMGIGKVIQSEDPGRARQMNLGARTAAGEGLLFLHADTLLPEDGLARVRSALQDPHVVGGRFRLGLSDGAPVFRLIGCLSTLRSRLLGITYGDQAIFVRREAFHAAGGFPDRRIFEDSEFCHRLARLGRFVMLDATVRTSARRWHRSGVIRTLLLMWGLRVLHTLSVPDHRLCRWYRDVR